MTPASAHPPPGSPPLPAPVHFFTSDGCLTAYRFYPPPGPPKALVIVLHGIQSHAGWYGWSSSKLAASGFAVAFLDRRGSGANPTRRGDAPHAERLINDVVQFAAHLGRLGFTGVPKVLTAISWGGKLATAVASRRPDLFDGLALLTPGICAKIRPNAAQRVAIRTATSLGVGRRELPIPLDDPALFTDSPIHRDFIRDDPLTLRRATVRFLGVSLSLDHLVAAHASTIRVPLLVQLAGRDRIIDNGATRAFLESLPSREKTLIEYPSACHTLEFEPNRHEIVDDLTGWIECVVTARTAGSALSAP